MRILPIFRARDADAKTARSGNARTMDELYERFKLKHGILIFTEGSAYPEKALRPLKNCTPFVFPSEDVLIVWISLAMSEITESN